MSDEREVMEHAQELIPFAERTEIMHRNYLAEFREKVWPMYQRYGFSLDAAMTIWMLNKLMNNIEELIDLMREDDEPEPF